MLSQAHYFQQNPEDGRAMLADNVSHPFNEWLALIVNYGVTAFILLASYMCPNRFAPLVGLMRLYAATGRAEEAKAIAGTIVSKEVKVVSSRVMLFIDEAKRFLGKY